MPSPTVSVPNSRRLPSLDAYRGFVMLLMASEGLALGAVASHYADSGFWKFIDYQISHVEWRGCALWDLIQPSFSFLVGVALPWSLANRVARGDSFGKLLTHTLWRAFLLSALGVFLRSTHSSQTNFTFEDTLTQIGFGYTFLWLLAWTKPRTQALAAGLILVGYWLAFALHPLPPPNFDTTTVDVPAHWPHQLNGFAAHWNKNTNFAHTADVWIMNLFPRAKPFLFNGGGYLTLSFIPTLATMILGLLAANLLRSSRTESDKIRHLIIAGVAGLAIGTVLDLTGICPSVKRIWTPSWVLFSGGWCSLFLAFFYGIIEVKQKLNWAFPMTVVGMNSIAMYCMAHLFDGFFKKNLKTHLGKGFWEHFGIWGPVWEQTVVLALLWWICYWMWTRKLFLKI